MKKIEIQTAISTCLNKKPITLKDLLNASIKLTSYDDFIREFRYIANTFKNIPEFLKIAQDFIAKMDTFIDSCNFDDNASLMNHLNANLYNKICGSYSTQITLKTLSSVSLNKSTESSLYTLQQIYDELGYSNLIFYIELINSPSNFTSYINSSDKQLVAMHYLLFRTNHHSSTKLKRDLTIAKLYQIMQENLSDSLLTITSEKEDFVTFMNEEKQLFETWYKGACEKSEQLYSESRSEYQTFLDESKVAIEQLKKTYSDELKLKDPAEFMKNESERYKT